MHFLEPPERLPNASITPIEAFEGKVREKLDFSVKRSKNFYRIKFKSISSIFIKNRWEM
jgi:hypothetical protein